MDLVIRKISKAYLAAKKSAAQAGPVNSQSTVESRAKIAQTMAGDGIDPKSEPAQAVLDELAPTGPVENQKDEDAALHTERAEIPAPVEEPKKVADTAPLNLLLKK